MGMGWQLIVIFICISSVINNVELLFMCLLTDSFYLFFEEMSVPVLCYIASFKQLEHEHINKPGRRNKVKIYEIEKAK